MPSTLQQPPHSQKCLHMCVQRSAQPPPSGTRVVHRTCGPAHALPCRPFLRSAFCGGVGVWPCLHCNHTEPPLQSSSSGATAAVHRTYGPAHDGCLCLSCFRAFPPVGFELGSVALASSATHDSTQRSAFRRLETFSDYKPARHRTPPAQSSVVTNRKKYYPHGSESLRGMRAP